MITTEAVLGLLFGLGVKHLIVDFMLQPPYMYLNKGRFMHPGGVLHSTLHTTVTVIVLGIWSVANHTAKLDGVDIMVISMLEAVWHYATDYTKVRICKRFGWRALPPNGKERDAVELAKCNRFWVALGVDQFSHFCNYLVIAWIVVSAVSA